MMIKWLGHSAFLITASDGTKIITDPYTAGSYDGAVGYQPIKEDAQIVTVSHEHPDHNDTKQIPGKPTIVKEAGEHSIKGITISGFSCFHDESQGRERGANTVFTFEIDGVKICHLGDLGEKLSAGSCKNLGPVDVLLIPVGGHFTIDAKTAGEVVTILNPRVVIPMHYKTGVLGFPVAPVDDFLKNKANVKRLNSTEVELSKATLPKTQEIWVLNHAL
jgi:L-ascorbate metabolism protein UlaG (beta-lactamase superfamily)